MYNIGTKEERTVPLMKWLIWENYDSYSETDKVLLIEMSIIRFFRTESLVKRYRHSFDFLLDVSTPKKVTPYLMNMALAHLINENIVLKIMSSSNHWMFVLATDKREDY